ncbi:hypothetical protein PDJAM_G00252720 [Pangasius djambal]|uniref:Uncharacterized protein n=1 Tax=Pangasius djambal TaxID=1691987 RepID=A0ACC5YJR4_9TELE|nr:hypothetical protein [Pangasius djambal]
MPISLQRMSLDRGRKPEYPEETPESRGEHVRKAHTGQRRDSNPQPWRSIRAGLVSRVQRATQGVVRWQSGAQGRPEAGKDRAELRKHEHCHTDTNNQATAFSEHCFPKDFPKTEEQT